MKPFSRRQIVAMLVAFACIAGGLWLFRESRTSYDDAEWLSSRPAPRRSRLEFLGRWMWPVKRQIARVREKVIGPQKIIDLHAVIVTIDPRLPLSFSSALFTRTNRSGDALFVFSKPEFRQELERLPGVQVVSKPQIAAGDGVMAKIGASHFLAIAQGTNASSEQIGWWLDVWPYARGSAVDLDCFMLVTARGFRGTKDGEAPRMETFVQTNVEFGARVSLPANGQLLLLSHTTNDDGKVVAALLSPEIRKR